MSTKPFVRPLIFFGMAVLFAFALVQFANPIEVAHSEGGSQAIYLPFIGRAYEPGLGTISGKVSDAVNGRFLDGVNDEAQVCTQSQCVFADSQGDYIITGLPSGAHWLTANAQGYVDSNVLVNVDANTNLVQNFPLSPDDLGDDQYRIVLTWDDDPPDLDAHLWTPYLVDGFPHVWQANRGDCTGFPPTEACLDLDDQNGYGPETITILEAPSATSSNAFFYYAVEKFEPCTPDCPTPIQNSSAIIQLYGGSGLLDTFRLPSTPNPGNKRFWYVFNIEYLDGDFVDIHTVNCYTDHPMPGGSNDDPPVCPP